MASSLIYLREVLQRGHLRMGQGFLKDEVEEVKLETFHGQGRLVLIVIDYIIQQLSEDDKVIDLLKDLENLATLCKSGTYSQEFETFPKILASFVRELRVFFRVLNQKTWASAANTIRPHELVFVFINFLLQILDAALHLELDFFVQSARSLIDNLRTELEFLITFLGDTPSQHHVEGEEIPNILKDISALVNEVGSLLYSFLFSSLENIWTNVQVVDEVGSFSNFFFFPSDEQILMEESTDVALSDLLAKFELLKSKIKEHCITFSKMPIDSAPKTRVVSLFILDSLLDDLKYLLNHNPGRLFGVNDQIVKLNDKLMWLRSSLSRDVAVQHPIEIELVTRANNIACEVAHIINSYPPDWYLVLRLPQVIDEIKLLRMAIEEMKNSVDSTCPSAQGSSQDRRPPVVEDIVVGFDNETIKIIDQLVGGSGHLQIISISGMPGIGKTTLAKKLYNDPYVVYHFDKRAWCFVSQTYRRRNILVEILTSLGQLKRETIINLEDEALAEELYKSLKGKRYLLIMDDIWDDDCWYDLQRYLPDDRTGSRVLFTTRHKEVGSLASPSNILNELRFLSMEECWDLLQHKVFQKKGCPHELQDIGKHIATNCHGLPLAVVLIAAVLANMEKKELLWRTVANSLNSHIFEDPSECINILKLSYEHLPMHLKPCFLYFGIFKKNEEIHVRKLMSLWIAEGFIKKDRQKSSEEMALTYLKELINRSLVLVVKRRSDGEIKTCRLHDLIGDLCLQIGREENFLKLMEVQLPSMSSSASHSDSSSTPLYVRCLIRSIHDNCSLFLFCTYRDVRVLDLFGTNLIYIDLVGIEQMIHLRYLAVPHKMESITSLQRLEFLLVYNIDIVEISDILLTMVNLRHLYFRSGAKFCDSCHKRASKNMKFPVNNLQYISFLSLVDDMDEEILRCSPNLRRLKCEVKVLKNSPAPRIHYPSFDFFAQLESLSLSAYYNRAVGSITDLISLPMNLKRLTLSMFNLYQEQLSIIGSLENLEVLKLKDAAFEETRWDSHEGEFPRLKFLKLDSVRLTKWNASSDHFPRLQQLVLRYLNDLEMIPSGLGDIPTLQVIHLHWCGRSTVESALQIEENQQDLGNEELKVVISGYKLLW